MDKFTYLTSVMKMAGCGIFDVNIQLGEATDMFDVVSNLTFKHLQL